MITRSRTEFAGQRIASQPALCSVLRHGHALASGARRPAPPRRIVASPHSSRNRTTERRMK